MVSGLIKPRGPRMGDLDASLNFLGGDLDEWVLPKGASEVEEAEGFRSR